jgi:hypothetical protein
LRRGQGREMVAQEEEFGSVEGVQRSGRVWRREHWAERAPGGLRGQAMGSSCQKKQCVGSRLTRKTILQREGLLEGQRDRDTETETERARERDYKDGK